MYIYKTNWATNHLPVEHWQRFESKKIQSLLVELQMYSHKGKNRLLDNMMLRGIILIYKENHHARLYQMLGPHLRKLRGSILYFEIKYEFYQ